MKKKVIVYSDYICPFCYIGKNRIDRLQEEFEIDVEWRGLEIHPETPPEGQTLKKMGLSSHYIHMVREHVNQLAAQIDLKLKTPVKVSNSKKALLLCEFAKENGRFEEYHSEVFKSYWQEGKDIGNEEILFKIIKNIGLDPESARDYLKENKAFVKMEEFLRQARAWGIDGVPTFIIGRVRIEGAQPYEILKKALEDCE